LGANVYLDGNLLVTANLGTGDTPTTSAPGTLSPLSRAYLLPSGALAGGAAAAQGAKTHQLAVELFSQATPGSEQSLNVRLEAFEALDVTASQWLPLDPIRFVDGVRAVLGGTADIRSLSDNYLIMRYQAAKTNHASWKSDPANPAKNLTWSQW